jgi:hypothetical protein
MSESAGDDIERDEHVAVYLRFRQVFGDATGRSATARKRKTKKEGGASVLGSSFDTDDLFQAALARSFRETGVQDGEN